MSGSQEENLKAQKNDPADEPTLALRADASASSFPQKSPSRPPGGDTATTLDQARTTKEPRRSALTGSHRLDDDWLGLIVGERWKLVERIGKGGMSVVYKAQHLTLGKSVAVKMLLPHLIHEDMVAVQRFIQEAKAASNLSHPNVITVHDQGTTPEGDAFIIMDFLDGESLADLIQVRGHLAADEACDIFFQTANGLHHAHSKGVIHRDLKPSNLMLVQSDYHVGVKIVDFGIAKVTSNYETGNTKNNLTKTGDVFGSPYYMSPEQCQGKRLDCRSDIYSMGCLMYETLQGDPPFVGENPLDSMYRHIHNEAPWLVKNNSPDSLMKRLDEIIQKCLEKNPADRYQTAQDLAIDLARARDATAQDWRSKSLAARTYRARQHRGDLSWRIRRISQRIVPPLLGVVLIGGVWLDTDSHSSFSKYKSFRTAALTDMLEPPPIVAEQPPPEDELNVGTLARFDKSIGVNSYPVQIKALHDDGKYYQSRGQWVQAAGYWEQGAELTHNESKRDSIFEANDLYRAGLCEYYLARSTPSDTSTGAIQRHTIDENAIGHLRRSIRIISKSLFNLINTGSTDVFTHPSSTLLIEPYKALSYAEEDAGDLDQAAAACQNLLRLPPERLAEYGLGFKVTWRMADLDRRIGTMNSNDARLESARRYFEQALSLASTSAVINDNETMSKVHYGLALTERELAVHSKTASPALLKEAAQNFKEAIARGRGTLPARLIGTMQIDYADVLWRRGDYADSIQQRFEALVSFHSG